MTLRRVLRGAVLAAAGLATIAPAASAEVVYDRASDCIHADPAERRHP